MIVVLAGAVEFTPWDIAIILGLLALFVFGNVCLIAGELLLPITLTPRTDGWALGFIPLVGPHMIVHHWRMGAAWHGWLAGTLVVALLFSVAPPQVIGPFMVVLALLTHFAVRLLVAYKQQGRGPRAMGWRWLLTPVACLALPFVYAGTIRAQRRPAQGNGAALADLPPPTGPPVGGQPPAGSPAWPPPGRSSLGPSGGRPRGPTCPPSLHRRRAARTAECTRRRSCERSAGDDRPPRVWFPCRHAGLGARG